MGDRPKFQVISVDWETAARAQGLACVVCKDTPTELDREEYFTSGLCVTCASAIMSSQPAPQSDILER